MALGLFPRTDIFTIFTHLIFALKPLKPFIYRLIATLTYLPLTSILSSHRLYYSKSYPHKLSSLNLIKRDPSFHRRPNNFSTNKYHWNLFHSTKFELSFEISQIQFYTHHSSMPFHYFLFILLFLDITTYCLHSFRYFSSKCLCVYTMLT